MWTSKISKNEVYCIAVAKYTEHLGFASVKLNPEHQDHKPFKLLQFTTLNVNEVALVTAVVFMLMKLRHHIV